MADLREMCGAKNGWHGFIDQTECIKRLMAMSNNPDLAPTNPYIALYLFEADKLIDDVRHKRISEAKASVELQGTYLDVLSRQSAANESAARISALQQQQQAEQLRLAADARAREQQRQEAAQAAAEAVQQQQNEENQRVARQAALEQIRQQCRAAMQLNHNGINFDGLAQCDADPYAYLRQRRINCSGNGTNQMTCTESGGVVP